MRKIATSLPDFCFSNRAYSATIADFFWKATTSACLRNLASRDVRARQSFVFRKNVVRGLHYQIRQPQGKLVRVVTGEVLDVALDCDATLPPSGSGKPSAFRGEQTHPMDSTRICSRLPGRVRGGHVLYKATDFYAPEHERTVAWNDPALNIDWHVDGAAIVSAKDQIGVPFERAETFD